MIKESLICSNDHLIKGGIIITLKAVFTKIFKKKAQTPKESDHPEEVVNRETADHLISPQHASISISLQTAKRDLAKIKNQFADVSKNLETF